MITFDLPVSGGKTHNTSSSKELMISSYQGNLVRSPYDGVIYSVDPNHCGGHIKIEHNVDGNNYLSNFCEVNRITVNRGDSVRKNHSIGIMGDKDIVYSILDRGGKKVPFKPFFDGIDNDSKTKEPKKDEKTEKDPKKSETNDLGVPKDTDSQDLISQIGLAPFNLAHNLFGSKFKPVIENKILQEELNRIKQLLK
jgi:hypothetical protein